MHLQLHEDLAAQNMYFMVTSPINELHLAFLVTDVALGTIIYRLGYTHALHHALAIGSIAILCLPSCMHVCYICSNLVTSSIR